MTQILTECGSLLMHRVSGYIPVLMQEPLGRLSICWLLSGRLHGMYLSMILGTNFSSESGPKIPLSVSLLIRFGGHVTTKKGTTWLFDNEKGSHLWHISTHPCANGVAQTVPEAFLPPTMQRLSTCPAACPTSAAARHRVPDSRCGLLLQSHAKSRPRRRRRGGCGRARLGLDWCGTLEQPHGRLLPAARCRGGLCHRRIRDLALVALS